MAWNKIGNIAALSLAFLLAACGDDSSSNSPENTSVSDSDLVVATFDNLPVCSSNREGLTAYVKDEKKAFICENYNWNPEDECASSSVNATARPESSATENNNLSSNDGWSISLSSSEIKQSSSSYNSRPNPKSSSSALIVLSSNSDDVVESSSSLVIPDGWSWNLPKETYQNTKINYGSLIDYRDKKVYKTVKIGNQTWMAENLNYADSVKMPSLKGKSWCYNNEDANCDLGGRLYTWSAAMDSVKTGCGDGLTCTPTLPVQGACPSGWHLPSQEEWNTLFTAIGGQSIAGKILKSKSGWYNKGNGTDSVGFTVLPVGFRSDDYIFKYDGNGAIFWSSTRDGNFHSYRMYLYCYYDNAYLDNYGNNNYAFSIRCLKD